MNYQIFVERILQELTGALAPGVTPRLKSRQEADGSTEDFIMFSPQDRTKIVAYPVISLRKCYELYMASGSITRVISKILYSIDHATTIMGISPEDFTHYEKVKDNICLKLVNYEINRELLADTPHIRYYDLALTCIYLTKREEDQGLQSIQIRNQYLNLWGVTEKSLLKQAIENSVKLMQPQIVPMKEVLSGLPNFPKNDKRSKNMYILTNMNRFLGAVCMTFPGVLEDFANKLNSDLIILPSSTHEVIIVPDDGKIFEDPDEFNRIIRSINEDIVDPMDRLSDHFYRFDRENLKLQY